MQTIPQKPLYGLKNVKGLKTMCTQDLQRLAFEFDLSLNGTASVEDILLSLSIVPWS